MGFPLVIDNTMVRAWRSCPKKFWWSFMRNLHATDLSVHLVAGGAFAKGLEVTRKQHFDKGIPFEEAIAYGGAALLAEYGDYNPIPRYERKSAINILGALGHYFEEWPIGSRLVPYKPPGSDRHAIEFSFAAPVPYVAHPDTGDYILYAGRFDFVGTYDGLLFGVDDKTASQLGQSWLDQWALSNQTLGYTWGARENGLRLHGFEVRGTSLLTNGYGHSESTQIMADWKVDAFQRELTATVQEMVRDYERDAWRMDLGQTCSAYGGCSFLMLCDSQTPEDWIPVNYEHRVWDPLAVRD